MLKAFIHVARSSENRLERRLARVQQSANKLNADAGDHMKFLNDTMVELTSRMSRVQAVIDSSEKLTQAG